MAAKIGAALLEENNFLKEKNIRLEATIETLEEKIEKMESEENKFINKIERLLQNISETQVQLEKEKKLRLDTQAFFEEHDNKQGQFIDDYVKTISNLKNTIRNLEKNITSNRDTRNQKIGVSKNVETQTLSADLHTKVIEFTSPEAQTTGTDLHKQGNLALVLYQLTQLTTRQDQVEHQLQMLHQQMQNQNKLEPNTSVKVTQNTPIIRKGSFSKITSLASSKIRPVQRQNQFSISLQVAKNKKHVKEKSNTVTNAMHYNTHSNYEEVTATRPPRNNTLTVHKVKDRKPPMTATKLEKEETYEDFLNKYIDSLGTISPACKKVEHVLSKTAGQDSPHNLNIDISHTASKESDHTSLLNDSHFLGIIHKREKYKPITNKPNTRTFWNTAQKQTKPPQSLSYTKMLED
ncbi:hypothetical protein J6590_093781 [Homalodisca vitripennis]|nr:hypothetical protein J6590_093781 [Homalodisca vitripennis]